METGDPLKLPMRHTGENLRENELTGMHPTSPEKAPAAVKS
jgi:hypothetical protein